MAELEEFKPSKKATFKITFLRGRKESSHIEIVDYVEALDPSAALNLALELAEKYHWHLERLERLLEKKES